MRRGLVVALLLAGCARPPVSGGAVATVPGAQCDANAAQALVGRAAGEVAAEAQRLSGARAVRRYASGDVLTMDFRPDRLNIETDAAGKVVKLSCG